MRKPLLFLLSLLSFTYSKSQTYNRLGWTNDVQFNFERMKYSNYDDPQTSAVRSIKFNNVNCRFSGSPIGTLIFENDTKFFLGEYVDFGFGVGIGKKSGGTTYDGTTFNMMIGANLGFVTSYSVNEDFTFGLKTILWGGDLYFDFDENAAFYNGKTFYPTIGFKQVQASIGFGGRSFDGNNLGKSTKIIDTELRFNFSDDRDEYWYGALKYRKSTLRTEYNPDSKNYRETGSLIFMVGMVW